MRKSALERLRESQAKKKGVSKEIRGTHLVEDLAELLLGGELRPTQRAVLLSEDENIAYMGHAGAAKTATGVCKILQRCVLLGGGRWLICRKDGNDLKNTTMREAIDQMGRLPVGTVIHRSMEDPVTYTFQPAAWLGLEGMSDEPTELIFSGAESLDMGSLNINGFFWDEADEIDDGGKKLRTLMGRCRNVKGGPRVRMLAFNGPSKEHALYAMCTGKDAKGMTVPGEPTFKLYIPKPRENEKNVVAGYYDDLEKLYANDPGLLSRYLKGEWVGHFEGIPVYPTFREHIHTRDTLDYEPASPVYVFWDFGYNQPRALFAQVAASGQLRILSEVVRQRMEIEPFVMVVRSELASMFPDPVGVVHMGDAAVRQKKDTGSTLAHLAKLNISIQYRLMELVPSVRAVRDLLNRMANGEPALIIDRRRCSILVDALKGGYRMRDDGKEPFKDGYFDNSADALRYGVVNLFGLTNSELVDGHPVGHRLPDSAEYDAAYDSPQGDPSDE